MPDAAETRLHHRACNLCEAICGLRITLEDGEITDLRGDPEDPLSRGHICPKAVALQDLQSDPDRLRRPLLRTGEAPGEGFREIPWEEAFERAAEGLGRVRREHGADAIAVYAGNPTVHNYGSMLFGPPFIKALGTRRRFSATSVDQLPHHVAAWWLFGHSLLLPVPDLERTEHLLILGANPLASNGSLMTAPGMRRRLGEIRERGGKVVVVDPRFTETAARADEHHFVRPGSDALLLAAMLAVLFAEDRVEPGRLAPLVDGVAELAEQVRAFPPERVAAATGVEAGEIRRLARELAAAPRAVVYGRLGVSVHPFGTLCQVLIHALNLLTGNLDRPGGALLTRPAVDLVERTGGGRMGKYHSRVRGLPEFSGELPVAVLAEEILTDGEDRIRGLVTSAGNPVLSTPDGRRLDRALESLDFMVSVDFYRNETTRHADLVLPPTAPLEHDHYDLVFHQLAVRNTARYSPPLFQPPADARHDWQIFAELERRLGRRNLRSRVTRWVRRRLGPRGLLALALRSGPRGAGWKPRGGDGELTLARLERAPHGVDLGPLEPSLPGRLRTDDGRIRVLPEPVVADFERLAGELAATGGGGGEEGRLLLIGRRQVRSNNSWMHNVPRLMRGEDRCTLMIHPRDAGRVGLEVGGDGGGDGGGSRVRVTSETGEVEVPVEVTEEIMPGVVSLPHGWGHGRPGVGLEVAARHAGASFNDLTDGERVDPLCGNAVLNGIPVRITPVA